MRCNNLHNCANMQHECQLKFSAGSIKNSNEMFATLKKLSIGNILPRLLICDTKTKERYNE